jgi:hypothetical protein
LGAEYYQELQELMEAKLKGPEHGIAAILLKLGESEDDE